MTPYIYAFGYEMHVFSRSVFFMLVLMTLVTTYMTTPLVRRMVRHTELEQSVMNSPFILGRRRKTVLSSE